MIRESLKSRPAASYSLILFIWVLGYFLPALAMEHTKWYGDYFHVLQSTIPLILIYAVYNLTQARWREELGMILILQIMLNLGDVIFDSDWRDYDRNQGILNALELIILVGWGLPDLLITLYRAKRDSRGPLDNRPNSRHGLAQDREGIQGNAR